MHDRSKKHDLKRHLKHCVVYQFSRLYIRQCFKWRCRSQF